jgi:hypothetical protein
MINPKPNAFVEGGTSDDEAAKANHRESQKRHSHAGIQNEQYNLVISIATTYA